MQMPGLSYDTGVRPSVRLSHAAILSKIRNLGLEISDFGAI